MQFEYFDAVGFPVYALIPDDQQRPTFAFWNNALEAATGINRDQTIGQTALEVFPGKNGRAIYGHHLMVQSTCMSDEFHILLDGPNGETEYQTKLHPLLTDEGRTKAIIGAKTDVMAVREGQRAEIMALALSQQAMDDMEHYISMAAHDLRSPMRQVAQIADMLRDHIGSEQKEAKELVDVLELLGEKAFSLISDVLDFSNTYRTKTIDEEFDLGKVAKDVFTVIDPQGLHTLKAEHIVLRGDPISTQIIIRNLVDNAIRHSSRKSCHIQVQCDDGDDGVVISVKDDHNGLENAGADFLSGGKFRKEPGFGLLGIRRMILARAGRIAAYPVNGGGTIVSFSMPGLNRPSAFETAKSA